MAFNRRQSACDPVLAFKHQAITWAIVDLVTRSCGIHLDGLVKERCNSISNALELRLSCTNPSIGLVQERRNSITNTLELRLSCTNPSNSVVSPLIVQCLALNQWPCSPLSGQVEAGVTYYILNCRRLAGRVRCRLWWLHKSGSIPNQPYQLPAWIINLPNSVMNSLAPGRSGFDFEKCNFNIVLLIGILRSPFDFDKALRWILYWWPSQHWVK